MTWEIEGVSHFISTHIIWKIALLITPNLSRGTNTEIADQSDKLFSRYLFLKTKLLCNEKIASKLADILE